jgi:hypothetical protein
MPRRFISRYIHTLIICSLVAMILIAALLISLHKDKSTDSAHNPTVSGFNSAREIPNSKISQTAAVNQPDYASGGVHRQGGDDYEVRKSFVFHGNQSFSPAQLKEVAHFVNSTDTEQLLGELSEKIRSLYRASGFLHVNVTAKIDPKNSDNILIDIYEGERFTWGEVKITSDDFPASKIAPLLGVQKGWPANFSEMGNMMHAYAETARELGYMDCAFTPDTSIDYTTGQVNLELDLHQGPRYVINEVSLDSPNAQSIFGKLQGEFYSPSVFESLLAQSGLTTDAIRLEFDASLGEVSIFSAAPK